MVCLWNAEVAVHTQMSPLTQLKPATLTQDMVSQHQLLSLRAGAQPCGSPWTSPPQAAGTCHPPHLQARPFAFPAGLPPSASGGHLADQADSVILRALRWALPRTDVGLLVCCSPWLPGGLGCQAAAVGSTFSGAAEAQRAAVAMGELGTGRWGAPGRLWGPGV